MKNTTVIITNYILSKFVSPKTSVSNSTEILQECFTSKTKQVAFLVNAILFIFFSLSVMGSQTKAASFSVNLNTDASDINPGNGVCDADLTAGTQCTLRAAIQESNALAGSDNITFSLSAPNEIDLSFGELSITEGVNITGPGARNLSVQRKSGAMNFRVFKIQALNLSVTISGITIAQGSLPFGPNNGEGEGGAGIQNLNGSSLALIDVTVRNNAASGTGGGIQNSGALSITRSTVNKNVGTQGAGIQNGSSGTMNISNSTISENVGSQVVTGATQLTGGIFNLGTLTINNATISDNSATSVGGVRNTDSATVNIRNTIVAGNSSQSVNPDVLGTFNSQGNNLIGVSGGSIGLTNGVSGNKTGSAATPVNPQLGALQNNGGQTDTHALLPGSPAIDAGNNCVAEFSPIGCLPVPLINDQRGTSFSRRVDSDGNGTATVDIGAYEVQLAPTAAEVVAGGRVLTTNGKGIQNVKIIATFPSGETRTTVSGESGFYQFEDLPAGETYIFTVSAKHYVFSQPTQVRTITEDTQNIDFVADALKTRKIE